jgi:hypothetical protein
VLSAPKEIPDAAGSVQKTSDQKTKANDALPRVHPRKAETVREKFIDRARSISTQIPSTAHTTNSVKKL